jgi:hypothetical protein
MPTVRDIMTKAIREMLSVSPDNADCLALRLVSTLYDHGWHIVQCDNAAGHHPKPH